MWEQIPGRSFSDQIINDAQNIKEQPIPDIRFSDYKEFFRSGDRTAYQKPAHKKKNNLITLVIVEGMEREGRYLDLTNDYLLSYCEQTVWVMSAHVNQYYNVEVPFKDYDYIDLGIVGTGQFLGEIAYIMNDLLAPEVKERLSKELEERLFTPFLRYNDFWWMQGQNNWNSVCHAGVINTAILQDVSDARLARMLQKTMENITTYMEKF